MKTLEEYLSLPWKEDITTVTDGEDVYVRLTVMGVPDFAVYGDAIPEVKGRWREAFASHLAGYLAVGKVIAEPPVFDEPTTEPADATSSDGESNMMGRESLIAA